jgi:hypothetical protein
MQLLAEVLQYKTEWLLVWNSSLDMHADQQTADGSGIAVASC